MEAFSKETVLPVLYIQASAMTFDMGGRCLLCQNIQIQTCSHPWTSNSNDFSVSLRLLPMHETAFATVRDAAGFQITQMLYYLAFDLDI